MTNFQGVTRNEHFEKNKMVIQLNIQWSISNLHLGRTFDPSTILCQYILELFLERCV